MPISRDDKLKYMRTFYALLRKTEKLPDQNARELLELLRAYRLEIVDIIAGAQGWASYYLPQLRTDIDNATEQLQRQMNSSINVNLSKAWEDGRDLVDKPFAEIGITTPVSGILIDDLFLAKELSADLVTGISDTARKDIMRQVQLSIMGNRSQTSVIQSIGRIIMSDTARQKAPQSTFKTLASRAEAIMRTETMRVMNGGHWAQAERTAQVFQDLRKYWIATYDSRARTAHLKVDAETNYNHGGMPILESKPFVVNGYKCRMPHDPALPASESVNCRCRMATTLLNAQDISEEFPDAKPPVEIKSKGK